MSDSSRRYRIGYALAPKKQQSFIQLSLVNLARSRGIDLIPIDFSRPLTEQGSFDCILHKLAGDNWKSQLTDFSRCNPGVLIVDTPDAIERLHNRISMLQVVSELVLPQQPQTCGIPKQIVIYDSADLSDPTVLGDLQFPIIAKPLVANSSAMSHKMSLVFNRDGMLKLRPPIVLQEFVNHGGVIFKVYVVGDYVKCVKRKSLPDVSEEKLGCNEATVSFSLVSNVATREDDETAAKVEEAEMPPLDFITEIAKGLRRAMGLQLFNFDVIRDARVGNHYLVIDINYFPGYAKMPSYETVLTDFFWDILHQNEREREKPIVSLDYLPKLLSCDGEDRKHVRSSHCLDGDDVNLPASTLSQEEENVVRV